MSLPEPTADGAGTESVSIQAADWIERLKEPGPLIRREFDDWLQQSPEHQRAYNAMLQLHQALKQVDPARKLTFDDVCATSASQLSAPLLVQPATARRGRRLMSLAVFVLLLSGVVFGGVRLSSSDLHWKEYQTGDTEEVFVRADGSKFTLAEATRLQVQYTITGRKVRVLSGRARFEVEEQWFRPFVVFSGTAVARAVGTDFEVLCEPPRSAVTVRDGKVEVRGESETVLMVEAGQRAVIDGDGRVALERTSAADGPNERMLDLSGKSLGEVADLFNRADESPRFIVTGDARARTAAYLIVRENDRTALLAYLKDQVGLSVTHTDREVRVQAR